MQEPTHQPARSQTQQALPSHPTTTPTTPNLNKSNHKLKNTSWWFYLPMSLFPLHPLITPALISIKPNMIQTPLFKPHSLLLKYGRVLYRRPMHNSTILAMTQFSIQWSGVDGELDSATVTSRMVERV